MANGEQSGSGGRSDWRVGLATGVGTATGAAIALFVIKPLVDIPGFWPGLIAFVAVTGVGAVLGRLVGGLLFRPLSGEPPDHSPRECGQNTAVREMTEQQWQTCTDARRMVLFTYQWERRTSQGREFDFDLSQRRWANLIVEILHRIRDFVDEPRLRQAITLVEDHFEGTEDPAKLRTALDLAQQVQDELIKRDDTYGFLYSIAKAIFYVCGFLTYVNYNSYLSLSGAVIAHFSRKYLDEEGRCQLIRCIFGNPFRPVEMDPSWRTPAVVDLARVIHDGRRYDELPLLADALVDGGCKNQDVLEHCRMPGDHVRDCWVIDGLLRQE